MDVDIDMSLRFRLEQRYPMLETTTYTHTITINTIAITIVYYNTFFKIVLIRKLVSGLGVCVLASNTAPTMPATINNNKPCDMFTIRKFFGVFPACDRQALMVSSTTALIYPQ